MPSRPTTRWQVSGYRFLVRRMEHALVRRDVRMLHDPMRSQSRAYAAGFILGCVALAGCGVLALLRPQGSIGDNKILVGKDSGAVYAVVDGVVHPALNLASARLAVGDPAKPVSIKESELSKKPRGALIGIPGGPVSMEFDTSGKGRAWTICDELKNDGSNAVTTTVIAGDPSLGTKASAMDRNRAMLVQGKDSTYLIYDNQRARVNMSDPAVADALGIRGMTPRPISPGLLNAIPEVLSIERPKIDDPGGVPTYDLGGHRIGDVVHVTTKDEYWVVLRDGIQQVSQLTADLIRYSNPSSSPNSEIDQFATSPVPHISPLPVGKYPNTAPTIVDAKDQPVGCMSWKPVPGAADKSDGSKRAELTVLTGHSLPIPDGAQPVRLAQADAPGQNVSQFYSTPGSGMFVQTTGIEPDSQRRDAEFYIADTGVRYGIKDTEAAKALGMDPEHAKPEPAPYPIVGLLAPGPSLGRQEAMVAHDGVAPDANPAKQLVKSKQDSSTSQN
ncbi:type VII secretion protein EccB [Nocardia terpenica]|uniref:Type VII secretion protein EccB n=1 Tax=Nocardia terpenica TaxID=455432 RepID=A0A164I8Z2_9NOCA|nr:type VII secretion protein EccB [Nocardia terpenica]KZM69210.1 type VII secretion protein EccB [Nocardia terpenica]MBF6061732.1 type VII secretion protein EccB [Nocardia terpenica]MBF6107473.1 type VII secretion protein EccB [Nocardia terpenica]MBF6110152.1 type VII secretion protein EccB [Nocardia terpenica]MBF6122336.1 type VII secretion protein EccB [Nocardia terpenica]